MPNIARWGAPAAVVAGVLWLISIIYLTLDELEYAGDIEDNPVPGPLGVPALPLAALATAIALRAVRSYVTGDGVGTKACFVIAYLGAAISLIPLWPAIFFGPLLVAVGLVLVGAAAMRSRGGASIGHHLHALGLPLVAIASPFLDLAGIMDGSLGVASFGAVLGLGLVWIGVDLYAAKDGTGIGARAAA